MNKDYISVNVKKELAEDFGKCIGIRIPTFFDLLMRKMLSDFEFYKDVVDKLWLKKRREDDALLKGHYAEEVSLEEDNQLSLFKELDAFGKKSDETNK